MSIEEKVKKIIADQRKVEPENLKSETSLRDDLGADSLDEVEIAMDLDEEFDIDISEEDRGKIKTVGDAINYVKSKG